MKNIDIIFKNGKTVTENGVEDCDIAVTDGKICEIGEINASAKIVEDVSNLLVLPGGIDAHVHICLLYTTPSPRDEQSSRMPSSA